jgi:hypothetical protein
MSLHVSSLWKNLKLVIIITFIEITGKAQSADLQKGTGSAVVAKYYL